MNADLALLLTLLAAHGVQAYADGSSIRVLDVFTVDCVPGAQWETIEATPRAVRAYLGY